MELGKILPGEHVTAVSLVQAPEGYTVCTHDCRSGEETWVTLHHQPDGAIALAWRGAMTRLENGRLVWKVWENWVA